MDPLPDDSWVPVVTCGLEVSGLEVGAAVTIAGLVAVEVVDSRTSPTQPAASGQLQMFWF